MRFLDTQSKENSTLKQSKKMDGKFTSMFSSLSDFPALHQILLAYTWSLLMTGGAFLGLAVRTGVGSLGSLTPPLLTDLALNWTLSPFWKPVAE